MILRRRTGTRVALLLPVLMALGCQSRGWEVRNLDADGKCIVILGDSLTAGYGIDPTAAYPALLEQRLGLPVIARGRFGDETGDGVQRFDTDVTQHQPFLVVIQLGGNDFTHRVSQDETFRNIEQLVLRTQHIGAAAVIVAVDTDPFGDSYGDGYRDIARRMGAGVVTGLLSDVFTKPQYMVDPIHPNEAGHPFLAQRVAAVLEPILMQMPAAQRLRGA